MGQKTASTRDQNVALMPQCEANSHQAAPHFVMAMETVICKRSPCISTMSVFLAISLQHAYRTFPQTDCGLWGFGDLGQRARADAVVRSPVNRWFLLPGGGLSVNNVNQ
jgi:hypothetical protein